MRYVPSVSVSHYMPSQESKLISDVEGQKQRADVLERQTWNTFFGGIRTAFTTIAGPLVGAGLAMFVSGLIGAAVDPLQAIQVGGSMMAGGAVSTSVALGANYLGAKFAHAANFDQLEVNAQHTAKYVGKAIRQELEEMQNEQAAAQVQHVAIFNNPEAQRNDGKSWAQHLDDQRAANMNQEQQV